MYIYKEILRAAKLRANNFYSVKKNLRITKLDEQVNREINCPGSEAYPAETVQTESRERLLVPLGFIEAGLGIGTCSAETVHIGRREISSLVYGWLAGTGPC